MSRKHSPVPITPWLWQYSVKASNEHRRIARLRWWQRHRGPVSDAIAWLLLLAAVAVVAATALAKGY